MYQNIHLDKYLTISTQLQSTPIYSVSVFDTYTGKSKSLVFFHQVFAGRSSLDGTSPWPNDASIEIVANENGENKKP